MESNKCAKCEVISRPDDCSTLLFDPECNHEICAKCLLAKNDDKTESETMQCPICESVVNLSKSDRRNLNLAQKKLSTTMILKCSKHENESIQVICKASG